MFRNTLFSCRQKIIKPGSLRGATNHTIMTTKEINSSLIGKRVKVMFTGLMAEGVITGIEDNQYSKGIVVALDSPIQWGDYLYDVVHSSARKIDEFGCLHHAELI